MQGRHVQDDVAVLGDEAVEDVPGQRRAIPRRRLVENNPYARHVPRNPSLAGSTIDESGPNLFGKVFSVSGPIQGASIRIKNSLVEAQSDFDGYFNIDAQVGDILMANYSAMIEK